MNLGMGENSVMGLRVVYVLFLVLGGVVQALAADGSGRLEVKQASISALTNGMRLVVELGAPGSVMVYYDTQKPARPDQVGTFWYNHFSSGETVRHVILLPELARPRQLYFRLEKKAGSGVLSELYHWDGSKTTPVK